MGGSLGLALKQLDWVEKVLGYDRNNVHQEKAVVLGLVDSCESLEAMAQCDVIVLAVPVEAIISLLEQLSGLQTRATVIDLGSTKRKITECCPPEIRSSLVAAHPMCGTEQFGPEAAIPDLYRNKIVVLCNLDESGTVQQQVAKNLFTSIGMRIVEMDAGEHDRHAAFISHLPHAISYALANSVLAQEDSQNVLLLAAGGFRDMSRIAKSSPDMWSEVFRQNREPLLEAIRHFEDELQVCKSMIKREEWDKLHEWMTCGVTLHEILD